MNRRSWHTPSWRLSTVSHSHSNSASSKLTNLNPLFWNSHLHIDQWASQLIVHMLWTESYVTEKIRLFSITSAQWDVNKSWSGMWCHARNSRRSFVPPVWNNSSDMTRFWKVRWLHGTLRRTCFAHDTPKPCSHTGGQNKQEKHSKDMKKRRGFCARRTQSAHSSFSAGESINQTNKQTLSISLIVPNPSI